MKPLQQAIQQAIHILESADPLPCEIEAANALQKALSDELQQAVEPVLYQRRMKPDWAGGRWTAWDDCSEATFKQVLIVPSLHGWTHQARALYLHPAPQTQKPVEPVARVESIMANGRPFISRLPGARLNEGDALYLHPPQPQLSECWYESDELKVCRKCGRLHDKAITSPQQAQAQKPVAWAMHRADGLVLDIICPEEHESHEGDYTTPLYLHPLAQPYDQQALELCAECGWKAIMPGEPCLVCNMSLNTQQAKQVPMSDAEIYTVMSSMVENPEPLEELIDCEEWPELVDVIRRIEAHHGIGGQP